MKKIFILCFIAISITLFLSACKPTQNPTTPQGSAAQSVQSSQSGKESSPVESSPKNEIKSVSIKEDTGIYIGKVDSNFIEIKLDSTGAPVEFSIMEAEDAIKGFNKNDKVRITYFINDEKQHVLKSIEKIK